MCSAWSRRMRKPNEAWPWFERLLQGSAVWLALQFRAEFLRQRRPDLPAARVLIARILSLRCRPPEAKCFWFRLPSMKPRRRANRLRYRLTRSRRPEQTARNRFDPGSKQCSRARAHRWSRSLTHRSAPARSKVESSRAALRTKPDRSVLPTI